MRDVFVEIWQTARRNKLRTTLTGFAVAWGIFMLIVLLGAGNGLINANLKQNENWLSNSIEVWGGTTSKAYQGLKEGRRVRLQTPDLAMTESDFLKLSMRWGHVMRPVQPSVMAMSISAPRYLVSILYIRRSTSTICFTVVL